MFIWGTIRGATIPRFPQPSHCFNRIGSTSIVLPSGKNYDANQRRNGHCPLPPVTVWDAISDLPKFEYLNPKKVYPNDEDSTSTVLKLPVSRSGHVGNQEQGYPSQPKTEYQRKLREKADRLLNHVTRTFDELNVERIVRISMFPNADHHSMFYKY